MKKRRRFIIRRSRRKASPTDNSQPRKRREGFFSEKRTKDRREFRVKVSGNRKWIFIGAAVIVACVTAIYFSIAYGGGIAGVMNTISKISGFF